MYAQKIQSQAQYNLTQLQNSIGEFQNLDEPIEMMKTGVAVDPSCFLTHPGMDSFYELDHGFKINNSYTHGKNLKLESRLQDRAPRCLAESDPRLTRSSPNLKQFFLYDIESSERVDIPAGKEPDRKEMNRFVRPSHDDLERSLQWKNIDLIHAKKGRDLAKVKEVAYKPDEDQKEFNQKVFSTSQGVVANLYRAECDFMIKEAVKED